MLYMMPCLLGLAKEEVELANVTTFDAACELLIKQFECTKERSVARLMALRMSPGDSMGTFLDTVCTLAHESQVDDVVAITVLRTALPA